MTKRTPGLARNPRDYYPTPDEPVRRLVPHLPTRPFTFLEPCAGDGAIVRALAAFAPHATCARAFDLEPQARGIARRDALSAVPYPAADLIVTNTPWPAPRMNGEPMLAFARRFLETGIPAWLLLPLDVAANVYLRPFAPRLAKVVPVGRVSWMGNGKAGLDNAAWFLLDPRHRGPTVLALGDPEPASFQAYPYVLPHAAARAREEAAV